MIGIITFHRAANYGTVLQTYALQQALNNLSAKNEVIDYRCEHIEKLYSPVPNISPIHLKHYLKEISQIGIKYKIRKRFDKFIEENICTSQPIDKAALKVASRKYDAVITGSDQVWHLALTGEDLTYALEFVDENVRKISYAASFGPATIQPKYLELLKPQLQRMDYISVREPSGAKTAEELVGRQATLDVDPTVLIAKEQWEKMAEKSKCSYSDYIFVYTMQPSNILYDVAEELARREHLNIYSISMVENRRNIGINTKGADVEDFLWMIKNARYVVTNSFHGILFSIRFHKNFYWAFQSGKHMSNPRFDMLTEMYGIDKRRCDTVDMMDKCSKMDYELIENILETQRKNSLSNLENSLYEKR